MEFKRLLVKGGRLFLSLVFIGVISGQASAFFLISLDSITAFRESNSYLIFFLPLAGLVLGYFYFYRARGLEDGMGLLHKANQGLQPVISVLLAPIILFATLFTHAFGGSAGREGTAIQMGVAFSEKVGSMFKMEPQFRRLLLASGAAAGFASLFGTPWAATFFAWETLRRSSKDLLFIPALALSAHVGTAACDIWPVQHLDLHINLPDNAPVSVLWVALFALIFSWVGVGYKLLHKKIHAFFESHISYPPYRPLMGGTLLMLLIWGGAWEDYAGLGLHMIYASFDAVALPPSFVIKLVLTALTLGAGFKGGEVTPLFFIGATLGSALSAWVPVSYDLLAGMGLIGVFSAVTHTPLACTLMGMELFGPHVAPYAAVSCFVSFAVARKVQSFLINRSAAV